MSTKERRKGSDVLCGLRSSTPSSSAANQRPQSTTKELDNEPESYVGESTPVPAPLTLPFHNPDRGSRLIPDEQFDSIMRQVQEDDHVPQLPPYLPQAWSTQGIRRTLSQARNTSIPRLSERPRPASADFKLIAQATGNHIRSDVSRSSIPRDPTLTALPRPPTKNDMAVYPSENAQSYPGCAPRPVEGNWPQQESTLGPRSQVNMPPPPPGPLKRRQDERKAHKRKFSFSTAVDNVVESVKKRIKRPETPSSLSRRISSPMSFHTAQDIPRPTSYQFFDGSRIYPNSVYPNAISRDFNANYSNTDNLSDTDNCDDPYRLEHHGYSQLSTEPNKKVSSTKVALKQTWETTKEVAKDTLDFVNPLPRIARLKEPEFVDAHERSRSTLSIGAPYNAVIGGNTTPSRPGMETVRRRPIGPPTPIINQAIPAGDANLSPPLNFPEAESGFQTTFTAYNLSTMTHQEQMAATFPFPAPPTRNLPVGTKPRHPQRELWETSPREVLGGEIKRLEKRTMKLLAINEGHENEIAYLRARVEQLLTVEASRECEEEGEAEGDLAGVGPGIEVEDVEMGEEQVFEEGQEDSLEDKRKTWMTCDSD